MLPPAVSLAAATKSGKLGASFSSSSADDLNGEALGIAHEEAVVEILLGGQTVLGELGCHGFAIEVVDRNREVVDDADGRLAVQRDDDARDAHANDLVLFVLVQDLEPEDLLVELD